MKAIFIIFNPAYYEAIVQNFDRQGIKGFSYWSSIRGRGSRGGEPHFGSHAWPTMNSSIIAVVEDEKVDKLLETLHEMDDKTPAQGLRAFVWNVEKTI